MSVSSALEPARWIHLSKTGCRPRPRYHPSACLLLYMDPTTEEFREAVVTYAGAAPELLAGMLQVNFQVPSDIELPETGYPAGIYQYALPVRLRIGDYESQTLTVWVSE